MAAVINSQIHFIRSIWTWVEFLGEVDIFLEKKTDAPEFFLFFFYLIGLKQNCLVLGHLLIIPHKIRMNFLYRQAWNCLG